MVALLGQNPSGREVGVVVKVATVATMVEKKKSIFFMLQQ